MISYVDLSIIIHVCSFVYHHSHVLFIIVCLFDYHNTDM